MQKDFSQTEQSQSFTFQGCFCIETNMRRYRNGYLVKYVFFPENGLISERLKNTKVGIIFAFMLSVIAYQSENAKEDYK